MNSYEENLATIKALTEVLEPFANADKRLQHEKFGPTYRVFLTVEYPLSGKQTGTVSREEITVSEALKKTFGK